VAEAEAPGSLPIWSCSVWGLPCLAHYCDSGALLPHLFTLTSMFPPGRYVFCGTFRRMARPSKLGRGTLPDVIRHTALRSSDFPPVFRRATVRSSCQQFIVAVVSRRSSVVRTRTSDLRPQASDLRRFGLRRVEPTVVPGGEPLIPGATSNDNSVVTPSAAPSRACAVRQAEGSRFWPAHGSSVAHARTQVPRQAFFARSAKKACSG
jgi:hypothetical protein